MIEDKIVDVATIMDELMKEGVIFCSEADFQHALALKIKENFRKNEISGKVRLEYPIGDGNCHIDIMLFVGDKRYPIELKYKTKMIEEIKASEIDKFSLKNQSAQDIGKYLYHMDIKRIEGIMAKNPKEFGRGYTILLTNDASYRRKSKGQVCDFINLENNTYLKSEIKMNTKADWANKYKQFSLNGGPYKVRWQECTLQGHKFFYLINEIPAIM